MDVGKLPGVPKKRPVFGPPIRDNDNFLLYEPYPNPAMIILRSRNLRKPEKYLVAGSNQGDRL